MKKVIVLSLIFALLLTGCNKKTELKDNSKKEYNIIGSWERKTEDNIETILFDNNGHFSYYGSEGNPVNDYDLCSSYKLEDNIIKLNCEDASILDEIKILDVKDNILKLSFDGDERIFKTIVETLD